MKNANAIASANYQLKLVSSNKNTVTYTINTGTKVHTKGLKADDTFVNRCHTYQIIDGEIKMIKLSAKAEGGGGILSKAVKAVKALQPIQSEFPINQRFEFMSKFVQMVLNGELVSTMITGDGGLGKTHTVLEELENAYLEQVDADVQEMVEGEEDVDAPGDYIIIKGYATPKALYVTLYENRNRLVIFDDCDSILKDPTALNILKGALDSYNVRRISWLSKGFIDDGLPRSFEFKGQVIFISNMSPTKIDKAVKSRTILTDLSMTTKDKIERMRFILPNILPNIAMDVKEATMDYLEDHAEEAVELNLRTLQMASKVVNSYGLENDGLWKDAVKYILTSS